MVTQCQAKGVLTPANSGISISASHSVPIVIPTSDCCLRPRRQTRTCVETWRESRTRFHRAELLQVSVAIDDGGQESLSTMCDNLRVKGSQVHHSFADYYSSTLTSLDTTCHGIAGAPAIYPGVYSEFEYLDKQELLSTPVRQRFFPRASPSILKALLETPPMRIYSPEASDEPCPRLGRAGDSSTRVLETSFLAKPHGLDETQPSRAPAPASLPSSNATALPLRLSLLPSSSAAPGLASSDSFALSLPNSDVGSSLAMHMRVHTQSPGRAPPSHSKPDPFMAFRRSSRSHARPAPPARFPELLCPTVPASPQASAAPTRPAGCEGPPSPSSLSAYGTTRLSRPHDPRRVMDSRLSLGMLDEYQRVMQELHRQGLGDGSESDEDDRSVSACSNDDNDDDDDDDDDDIVIGVEPPSPSPKPGRSHLYSDAELKLDLESLATVTRGSPFSGSLAYYPHSQSQLSGSISDADLAGLIHGHGHGHGRDSLRLAATASAPLLCSLGPDLGSDDGHGVRTHTHTHNITEAVDTDTQRTRTRTSTPGAGSRFWQPRFSLHAAGGGSSGSSSGSAGASGVCASDGSRLPPSSTFAAMRRDFAALLADQADEEEAQAALLRAIADRLEKRARSKRHLVDAIA